MKQVVVYGIGVLGVTVVFLLGFSGEYNKYLEKVSPRLAKLARDM